MFSFIASCSKRHIIIYMTTFTAMIFNFIFAIPLCMQLQTNDFGNRILQHFQNEDRNFYVIFNNKGSEIGKAYYDVKRTAENRIELRTRTERTIATAYLTNIIESAWFFDEKGYPERCIRYRFVRDEKKRLLSPIRELFSFRDGKLNYESEYGRTKLAGSLNLKNGCFPFFGNGLDTWVLAAAIWNRDMEIRQGSLILAGRVFKEDTFRILLIHGEEYHLYGNRYDCTVFSLDFESRSAIAGTVHSQGSGSHPVLDSRAASEGYERIKFREWVKAKRENPFYQDAETRWEILKDSVLNSQEGRPAITAELYVADGRLIALNDSILGRIVLKEPETKIKATYEFVK